MALSLLSPSWQHHIVRDSSHHLFSRPYHPPLICAVLRGAEHSVAPLVAWGCRSISKKREAFRIYVKMRSRGQDGVDFLTDLSTRPVGVCKRAPLVFSSFPSSLRTDGADRKVFRSGSSAASESASLRIVARLSSRW